MHSQTTELAADSWNGFARTHADRFCSACATPAARSIRESSAAYRRSVACRVATKPAPGTAVLATQRVMATRRTTSRRSGPCSALRATSAAARSTRGSRSRPSRAEPVSSNSASCHGCSRRSAASSRTPRPRPCCCRSSTRAAAPCARPSCTARDGTGTGALRARKYRMYGVFAGTWYFAPGSKSVAARATGGTTPWYCFRRSHQCWLYWSGFTLPENTSQRHLSTTSAERQERDLLERVPHLLVDRRLVVLDDLLRAGPSPSDTSASSTARRCRRSPRGSRRSRRSGTGSAACSTRRSSSCDRARGGSTPSSSCVFWMHILIRRSFDERHVPRARVTHDLLALRLLEHRALPERVGQRRHAERRVERLGHLHHLLLVVALLERRRDVDRAPAPDTARAPCTASPSSAPTCCRCRCAGIGPVFGTTLSPYFLLSLRRA